MAGKTSIQTSLIGREVLCRAPWLTLDSDATEAQRAILEHRLKTEPDKIPAWHNKRGVIVNVYLLGDDSTPQYTVEIDGEMVELTGRSVTTVRDPKPK
jgi:hypothetical protein